MLGFCAGGGPHLRTGLSDERVGGWEMEDGGGGGHVEREAEAQRGPLEIMNILGL